MTVAANGAARRPETAALFTSALTWWGGAGLNLRVEQETNAYCCVC
jgi:hypothetical protein